MVSLRDIRPEDKEKIREWRNLPEVATYMYSDHYITGQEHEKWFEAIFSDATRRYWVVKYKKEDIGLVNLYNIDNGNRRCYWAFYLISPNIRGRGVGSFIEYSILCYVFDKLDFNKLCCEVLSFNQKVINMHVSFGFSQEGYFRRHVAKGGQLLDVVSLAILKEEWESKKTEIEQRLRRKGLI